MVFIRIERREGFKSFRADWKTPSLDRQDFPQVERTEFGAAEWGKTLRWTDGWIDGPLLKRRIVKGGGMRVASSSLHFSLSLSRSFED